MTTNSHPLSQSTVDRRHLLKLAGAGACACTGMSLGGRAALAQDAVRLPFWLPGGSPLFCETH